MSKFEPKAVKVGNGERYLLDGDRCIILLTDAGTYAHYDVKNRRPSQYGWDFWCKGKDIGAAMEHLELEWDTRKQSYPR
jgi:uncharacterized protein YbdZ (MbtH family)